MGRELKRVPMDFSWPIGQTWKGYLNPYGSQKCKPCDGTGMNVETRKLHDDFYDFNRTGRRWRDKITQEEVVALQDAGRLTVLRVVDGKYARVRDDTITAEMVNAANRPGASMFNDLSHDGINMSILLETRARRLGVYGDCPYCSGDGEVWFSEEIKRLSEEWKPEQPPTGPGFQLWETTSEGSPVSPVFASLDELCEWCAENATTFAERRASAAEWRKMLDANFVCHRDENGNVFL